MSRFFKEDSYSSYESDSSSGSEESFVYDSEEEGNFYEKTLPATSSGPSKYMRGAESDSEDSDDGRKAKSQKQLLWESIVNAAKGIRTAYEDHQWQIIFDQFEIVTKSYVKASKFIEKDNRQYMFFIKLLMDVEDYLVETGEALKDEKLVLNTIDTKAYNAMKQRIRKYNKTFESAIEEFRKKPVEDEEFEEEEDDDWPIDDSSSDSDSSSSIDLDPRNRGISRWLKKEKASKGDGEKSKEKTTKKKPMVSINPEQTQPTDISDLRTESPIGEASASAKEIIAKKLADVNESNFSDKVIEFVAERGKKKTDRIEQLQLLTGLRDLAKTSVNKIKALIALISAQLDNLNLSTYMNIELWKSAKANVDEILDILEANPEIKFSESVIEYDPHDPSEENETRKNNVRGSLISFIMRLDDEFVKSLKIIDSYSTDYLDRLRNETSLYTLIVRAHAYLEKTGQDAAALATVFYRLEKIYYKPANIIRVTETLASKFIKGPIAEPTETIQKLAIQLIKGHPSIHKNRIQAILFLIYHHAIHDRFHEAKDMMLSSHLQETIHQTDVQTQIVFNRTMVQIGLCAFRLGLIKESHQCLHELYSTGKQKELLGQGVSGNQKYQEKTPEQERLDRMRLLPFHMHVNLDLLESVYLTTSMLLEIPNMAFADYSNDSRSRVISKQLRRFLDANERNAFSGPPESTRDYIIAASKALSQGDWKKCSDNICGIQIWNSFANATYLREMLSIKIREEALRTFLFKNSVCYTGLSSSLLSQLFDLDESRTHSIVARMILSNELHATIDQNNGIINFLRNERSTLESACMQLAERLANLLEEEERIYEFKYGGNSSNRRGKESSSGSGPNASRRGNSASRRNNNSNSNNQNNYNNNNNRTSNPIR